MDVWEYRVERQAISYKRIKFLCIIEKQKKFHDAQLKFLIKKTKLIRDEATLTR